MTKTTSKMNFMVNEKMAKMLREIAKQEGMKPGEFVNKAFRDYFENKK